MSRSTLVVALGLVGVSIGASVAYSEYGSDIKRLFGGRSSLSTATNADRVEVTRLDAPHSQESPNTLPAYPVLAGPVLPSSEDAARLTELLTSPSSYAWDPESAKSCIPSFGVQVTFHRGRERVDVLLCLDCAILIVFGNGQQVGGAHFDPADEKIVLIIKKLFPEDEEITQL
jgi:hypothetical protein